jgi:hypothetical protein
MEAAGATAMLVGESLMRQADVTALGLVRATSGVKGVAEKARRRRPSSGRSGAGVAFRSVVSKARISRPGSWWPP